MHPQPTQAVAPRTTTGSSRRYRRRALLASPPSDSGERGSNPGAAALAAAVAGPDARGYARSPITMPEYRMGQRPANAGRRFPAEVLRPEEVLAILDALPKHGACAARNRALIVVLWRCGLRIAEALALRPQDLDLGEGTVVILHGKGDRRRVVGMDRYSREYVAHWLKLRDKLGVPHGGPLFCTVSRDPAGPGRAVGSASVREMLKAAARRAGIDKRVHPHGLRHTHAFELACEGVPLLLIQKQLGHVDLTMTQRYIDHLAPVQLIKALRERDWPGQPPDTGAPRPIADHDAIPAPRGPSEPLEPTPHAPYKPPTPPTTRHAHKGVGREAVLAVIRDNGGSASQAQIGRALGIGPSTVVHHCRNLAAGGLIVPGGLDKRCGNRGSNIWRLPPIRAQWAPAAPTPPSRTLRLPAPKTSSQYVRPPRPHPRERR